MIHIKTKIIITNYFVELDGKNKRNISISVLKVVLYFNVLKNLTCFHMHAQSLQTLSNSLPPYGL